MNSKDGNVEKVKLHWNHYERPTYYIEKKRYDISQLQEFNKV